MMDYSICTLYVLRLLPEMTNMKSFYFFGAFSFFCPPFRSSWKWMLRCYYSITERTSDFFLYLFIYSLLSSHPIKILITFSTLCMMNFYLLIRDIDVLFQFQALSAVLEPDCSEVVLLSVIPNETKAIEMEKPAVFVLFLPKTASSKWLKHSSFYVILGVKVKLPTASWLWGHSCVWWMLSAFYLFYSLIK